MCISNLLQIYTTLTIQDPSKPMLTYSSRELRELGDSIWHDNKYKVLNPGAISNIHRYKITRTKTSTSQRHVRQPRGVNKSNLKYIRTVNFIDKDPKPNIRIATANYSPRAHQPQHRCCTHNRNLDQRHTRGPSLA